MGCKGRGSCNPSAPSPPRHFGALSLHPGKSTRTAPTTGAVPGRGLSGRCPQQEVASETWVPPSTPEHPADPDGSRTYITLTPRSHLRDTSPLIALVDKMGAHLEATAPPPAREGELLPTTGRAVRSHASQGNFFIPVPSPFPFWCPPLCSCSLAPAALGGAAPGGPIPPKRPFLGLHAVPMRATEEALLEFGAKPSAAANPDEVSGR